MSEPKPTMPCRVCKGTGVINLGDLLCETLTRFYRTHGGFTALELHTQENAEKPKRGRFGGECTVNAVNNRLEKLRALGYLTRRREGKFFRYFRTKRRTPKAERAPQSPFE